MAKQFIGKLWFYYLFTALGIWFILAFPILILLISRKGWHRSAYAFRSHLSKAFLKVNGIPVQVIDRRMERYSEPMILCGNHASELDIIVLLSIFEGPYAFLGKQPLAKLPLFGQCFKVLDIAVDRENAIKAYGSYKAAQERLKDGYSVVIFPEGGISGDPAVLQPFKNGAFRLAADCHVPVLPVTIQKTWQVLHPYNQTGRPGKVKVVIHAQENLGDQSIEGLKSRVSNRIKEGFTL